MTHELFSFLILFPPLAIIWQIPRIILTHPSTSDEDVELLTQNPGREARHDFDIPDKREHPDCFDSAFYPPWPQDGGAWYMKDTDCYYPDLCFVFLATEEFSVMLLWRISVKQSCWNVFFLLSL